MRSRHVLLAVVLASPLGSLAGGCRFDASGVSDGDGGATPIDATPDDGALPLDADPTAIDDDVAHLPAAAEHGGTASLALADGAIIDTSAPSIVGVDLPAGVRFDTSPQDDRGPELAVLHVADLSVAGAVQVIGGRPLVIVATGTITIAAGAMLDAGARYSRPGAGGGGPGGGPAPGDAGAAGDGLSDGGGGGGGHVTVGGAGGDGICMQACAGTPASGGAGGDNYGDADITVLLAGSGGGSPPRNCDEVGLAGAGGGAIQLYAAVGVLLEGVVNAGGGGGDKGSYCDNADWSAAPGGGSGGAIYIQTAALTVGAAGGLYANGGGGGGAAGLLNLDGNNGHNGSVGTQTSPGAGLGIGGTGGGGGGSEADAQPGETRQFDDSNGGGGGGSAGRIAVRTRTPVNGALTASPVPDVDTYE